MARKIAGNEFPNHTAEVGRHQHVFQSRHALSHKLRIHRSQKLDKVQHRVINVLDGNSVGDYGLGIEIIEGRYLRRTW